LDADSEEGKAIIGSPDGRAPSWALIKNKGLLGTKRVSKVIIFTGDHARYSTRRSQRDSEALDEDKTMEELVSRSMLPYLLFIIENVKKSQDAPGPNAGTSG
jgi:hypothetical protein